MEVRFDKSTQFFKIILVVQALDVRLPWGF